MSNQAIQSKNRRRSPKVPLVSPPLKNGNYWKVLEGNVAVDDIVENNTLLGIADLSLCSTKPETSIQKLDAERPLFVLDLNGVLQYRVYTKGDTNRKATKAVLTSDIPFMQKKSFRLYIRPYVKEFLEFLFAYGDIAIATSMGDVNTNICIEEIFTTDQRRKLIFVLTKAVAKDHSTIPQEHRRSRILFIDDDPSKVKDNYIGSYYIIPTFDPTDGTSDNSLYNLMRSIPSLVGGW